ASARFRDRPTRRSSFVGSLRLSRHALGGRDAMRRLVSWDRSFLSLFIRRKPCLFSRASFWLGWLLRLSLVALRRLQPRRVFRRGGVVHGLRRSREPCAFSQSSVDFGVLAGLFAVSAQCDPF